MTDSPAKADRNPCQEWLTSHETWLRKVILARTGEPQAVDDVFQQLALAVVQNYHNLRDPERHPAWLHRMAVLHSLRHRRQMGRTRRAVDKLGQQAESPRSTSQSVLHFVLSQERNELTLAALDRLPSRDVELLMLKYDLRWSYQRIAEHLGIQVKTVDSRLVRARERLRKEVIDKQIEPGDL